MGEIKTYEDVFRFQQLLHSLYARTKDGTLAKGEAYEVTLRHETILDFFKNLKEYDRLNEQIFVDLGDSAGIYLEAVEDDKDSLLVYTRGDSDIQGFSKYGIKADRLELLVNPDPRKSCAALFRQPETKIWEYSRDKPYVQDGSIECILFYPHSSLITTAAHKSQVLTHFGLGYDQPNYKPVQNGESEYNWLNAVAQQIARKVLTPVEERFGKKIEGKARMNPGVPVRNSKGDMLGESQYPVVSFFMKGSRKIASHIELYINELVAQHIPYHAEVWSTRMNKKNKRSKAMKFEIMLEMPQ